MFENKRVVMVTPSGRRRYMEILFQHVLNQRPVVDEYHVWVNTKNQKDLDYFYYLEKEYPSFVLVKKLSEEEYIKDNPLEVETVNPLPYYNKNIGKFFKFCTDENSVYIRLDDDIVYMQKDFVEKIVDFRLRNPEPLLVYGTIINNSICDHILQKYGYYESMKDIDYYCTGNGWYDPLLAEQRHRYLLDNYLLKGESPKQVFDSWVLKDFDRFSVNCVCWKGSDFNTFGGQVGIDEEIELSMILPKYFNRPNVICGSAICSHFAFYPQRKHMDSTNILNEYIGIAKI